MKDRIKKIREHFGLTQEQFAQRINKSYALISLVETGKKNFSGKTLEKICSTFSVNESWLLTGKGEMTDKAPIDRENIKVRIRQIRKENSLTQEEFGQSIGCCQQRISFIENGRCFPSDLLIRSISSVFGVNREWLLTGKGEMYGAQEEEIDDELLDWLRSHPEVIRELKERSGIHKKLVYNT